MTKNFSLRQGLKIKLSFFQFSHFPQQEKVRRRIRISQLSEKLQQYLCINSFKKERFLRVNNSYSCYTINNLPFCNKRHSKMFCHRKLMTCLSTVLFLTYTWSKVCRPLTITAKCPYWTFYSRLTSLSCYINCVLLGRLFTRCLSVTVGIYVHSQIKASVKSGTDIKRGDLAL